MSYQIVETTTFVVEGEHFATRIEAEQWVHLNKSYDSITQNGNLTLFDLMKADPEKLINKLQEFVAKNKEIISSTPGFDYMTWPSPCDEIMAARQCFDVLPENFDKDKAYAAGREYHHYIYTMKDLVDVAKLLVRDGKKLFAIKLVRNSFTNRPGLLEAKHWVENLPLLDAIL